MDWNFKRLPRLNRQPSRLCGNSQQLWLAVDEAKAAVNLDKRRLKAGNLATPVPSINLYSKTSIWYYRHFESFLSVDQSSTAHRLTSGPWKQPTKEQLDSWAPQAVVERDWRVGWVKFKFLSPIFTGSWISSRVIEKITLKCSWCLFGYPWPRHTLTLGLWKIIQGNKTVNFQ